MAKYVIKANGKQYIGRAKRHRILYVAQEIAGYDIEVQPDGTKVRVPRDFTIERVDGPTLPKVFEIPRWLRRTAR